MRRRLSLVLIVAGVLLLAEGALTLAWQEPASGLYARVQQERLENELDSVALPANAGPTMRERAAAVRSRLAPGDPVGRLRIPAIGVDTVVVEGTDPGELRSGPGHYPETPLPASSGTVAVAGHRTTYGAPFRRLDELERGDEIEFRMPYGPVRYRVDRTRIVEPDATWVAERAETPRLVLTACHPLWSAEQRIVVFAVPDVESRPHA